MVTSKGISVPYTNLQLNPYPNTQLDLFCSENFSFWCTAPNTWLTNYANPSMRLQSPTRKGCWLQSSSVHLTPLMHHSIAHIFFSFLPSSWFICLFMTKRGRVYWSLPECIVIFIWLMCTFLRGKNHKGDAYTKGEKILFMRKPYFVCFTLCLFSHCFIVL